MGGMIKKLKPKKVKPPVAMVPLLIHFPPHLLAAMRLKYGSRGIAPAVRAVMVKEIEAAQA